MNDLPTLYEIFTPPLEQPVVPGQSNDYVGVYCVGSHLTINTTTPPGYPAPKVERWHPVFDCEVPADLAAAGKGRFFVISFSGIPSERGRFGSCVREVRITRIAKATEGRQLRLDELVQKVPVPELQRRAIDATKGHPYFQEASSHVYCQPEVSYLGKDALLSAVRSRVPEASAAVLDRAIVVSFFTSSQIPKSLFGGGKIYTFILHPDSLEILDVSIGGWRS